MAKPILCLDFDGVLHEYSHFGDNISNDPPVFGAREFCINAQDSFELVIHSSRFSKPGGLETVQAWLQKNRFPVGITLSKEKPMAFVTLDDRAITFNGEWPAVGRLLMFQTWWQKRKDKVKSSGR